MLATCAVVCQRLLLCEVVLNRFNEVITFKIFKKISNHNSQKLRFMYYLVQVHVHLLLKTYQFNLEKLKKLEYLTLLKTNWTISLFHEWFLIFWTTERRIIA